MNRLLRHSFLRHVIGLLLLLRHLPCPAHEGNFDPAFGDGGRLLVNVSTLSTQDRLSRLIVRPDNKLLMAGTCEYTSHTIADATFDTFCVTQLQPDGSYDETFGPGGVGYLQFDRFSGWPQNTDLADMIVLRDGRIALLGNSNEAGNNVQQLIAVLLADGSGLDTSVRGSGYFTFQLVDASGRAAHLVEQSDDGIVVSGLATGINGNDDFAAARLLADFSGLDTDFGTGGSQTVAFDVGGPTGDNSDLCFGLALQSNGKIILAGYAIASAKGQPAGTQVAVTRLNTNGSVDTTFGGAGTGRVHYSDGYGIFSALAVAIDAGDRIVLGGGAATSATATSGLWMVDRLSRDGARDATFNQGNPQTFYAPPGDGGGVTRLALTSDGIIAVGLTPRSLTDASSYYFGVARLNLNGSLDPRFGNGGLSYGSFTATNDVDTTDVDIAVGNGGVMVAGTQTQSITGQSGNTRKFAVGRLQYDQIFSYGFE